ncbi:glycerophosphoryl diester phosphodiesterase membrane domain-containing protein [Promicromonospora soli]
MTTPESAPDQPAQPTPPQPGGSQPAGWGEPPRYGQYAPGYDPAAPPAQPPAGQPQYGTPPGGPGGGQYGQSQYGQYSPYSSQVPGYRPPADKPGIVPLRPLSLGELYDGAFGAVRHNPGVTLGLTALIVVAAVAVGTLISIPLTTLFTDLFGSLFAEIGDDAAFEGLGFTQDMLGVTYGSAIGTGMLLTLATPLAMGVMAISVSDSVIGRKISVSDAWSRVGKRWWFLIGFSLLSTLVVLVAYLLAAGIVAALVVYVDPAAGAITGLVLILALLVAAVWAFTRVALIPPALAVEGGGFWVTCRRAWKLTHGTFWRVLGIYLLTSIILGVIGQVVAVPVSLLMSLFIVLESGVGLAISYGVTYVITGGMSVLFLGGVIALLYIDTRMRREGLDVQLQAAAAATADK